MCAAYGRMETYADPLRRSPERLEPWLHLSTTTTPPRYILESPGGFLNPTMSSTSQVLGKCRLRSSPRWLEGSARTKKHVGQSPTGDAWPGLGHVGENEAGMKIRPGNWTLSCRP